MSISSDQIIDIYGKKYFDTLYDEHEKTNYNYKELLSQPDFTIDMAIKLPINPNILFLYAYDTNNEKLLIETCKKLKLYPVQLFNRALDNDDTKLLDLIINIIPKQFSVTYTTWGGNDWHPKRNDSNVDFSILDLVKYRKAKKCYKIMKNTMKFKRFRRTFPIKDSDYSFYKNTSTEGFILKL